MLQHVCMVSCVVSLALACTTDSDCGSHVCLGRGACFGDGPPIADRSRRAALATDGPGGHWHAASVSRVSQGVLYGGERAMSVVAEPAAGREVVGPFGGGGACGGLRRTGQHPRCTVSASPDRWEVTGSYETFCKISEDMRARAGIFEPNAHWHVLNAGHIEYILQGRPPLELSENATCISRAEYMERYASIKALAQPWLGIVSSFVEFSGFLVGALPSNISIISYMKRADCMGLFEQDVATQATSCNWLRADVNAMLDASMLFSALHVPDAGPGVVRIAEVGGGYGRLAEVIANVLGPGRGHHVLLDSVPGSLMYAYEYLRRALPMHSVGSHYAGDRYDAAFDVFVMPSWDMGALRSASFDVAVNIESFQVRLLWHAARFTHAQPLKFRLLSTVLRRSVISLLTQSLCQCH